MVLGLGGLFALLQLARGGASMLARERQAWAAQRISLAVRGRLFEHVLRLAPSGDGRWTRGDLLFRLTSDVRAVETFFNWDRVAADLRRIGHELAPAGAGVAS